MQHAYAFSLSYKCRSTLRIGIACWRGLQRQLEMADEHRSKNERCFLQAAAGSKRRAERREQARESKCTGRHAEKEDVRGPVSWRHRRLAV